MITADQANSRNSIIKGDKPAMSTNNAPSNSPATNKRRLAMIIAMIPLGAIVGFIGGLLIVIIVGLIARSVFSAEHPGTDVWQLLGLLPGLGALIGAIAGPILYRRGGRSSGG
jgi:hypothetical protein